MKLIRAFTLFLVFPAWGLSQSVWYVPDHFSLPQDALNSSSVIHGDTVIVRPGIYMSGADFLGKAVTLKSEAGPEFTCLDFIGARVNFENREGPDSVLDGFTVTNSAFGGIVCFNSSPTIINNIIRSNKAGVGGGILCSNASPLIMNNIIEKNVAEGAIMGGGFGGGIYCMSYSHPRIINNIITKNISKGAHFISGNGGGVFCESNSFALLMNNTITNNSATTTTGANQGFGGGVSGNRSLVMVNTIVWNNQAAYYPEVCGAPSVTFCNVKGGFTGKGNLDKDPLFVSGPKGDFYLSQIAAGQAFDSPCLNAGFNLALNHGMDKAWTRTDGICDKNKTDMGFHYGPYFLPPLGINKDLLSAIKGGDAVLHIHGTKENAYRRYLLLGSVTGTYPGTKLPGGAAILPLVWDDFTKHIINFLNTPTFSSFMGILDKNGDGAANLSLLPVPRYLGLKMWFAYGLNAPWDFVSNPVELNIGL